MKTLSLACVLLGGGAQDASPQQNAGEGERFHGRYDGRRVSESFRGRPAPFVIPPDSRVQGTSHPRDRQRAVAVNHGEAAALQPVHRFLDRALGESGALGENAQTDGLALPLASVRGPPQEQVDQEGGGLAVVADEVLHQRVDDVGVDLEPFSCRGPRGRGLALVAIAGISDLDDPEALAETDGRNGNSLRSDTMIKGIKFASVPVTGSGPRAGILHGAARLHRRHRSAVQRQAALDRAAHPRCPDPPGAVHAGRLGRPDRHLHQHLLHHGRHRKHLPGALGPRRETSAPPKATEWGSFVIFKDPDGNSFVLSSR